MLSYILDFALAFTFTVPDSLSNLIRNTCSKSTLKTLGTKGILEKGPSDPVHLDAGYTTGTP